MDDESEQTPLPSTIEDHPDEKFQESAPAGIEEINKGGASPPDSSNGSQSWQAILQRLTDRALEFLSTASNETLGACLVGLGATTYFVLGRVGLVIIGVAGGVVLHATWEKAAGDGTRSIEERRKEVGLDVIHRVLKWREEREDGRGEGDETAVPDRIDLQSERKLDFEGFRPETKAALEELTDAVIRDYVKWWYSPILPNEETFPQSSRRTYVAFLLGISNHMSRKRPANVFLDFLTHSSSILTVFFNELYTAVNASPTASVSDAIDTYLKLKPNSNLANIVDVENQEKKLMLVAEDILECYLDPKAYNCEPARIFLQQMLAKVCIEYTIIACSKPEFINDWIVYLLEEGEPELMKEIDAGVEGVADGSLVKDQNVVESAVEDADIQRAAHHKRVVSKAQEAMDDAMREAQRLSQMIAEHDAQRFREQQSPDETTLKQKPEQATLSSGVTPSSSGILHDNNSESTTQGIDTPSSSRSDAHGEEDSEEPQHTTSPASHVVAEDQVEPAALQAAAFTSFDQLDPNLVRTESQVSASSKEVEPLTLYNAKVTLYDDSDPSDRKAIKQKPTMDYMIQLEPATSHYTGWMIFRKYIDFENLHEVLGRIAKVSGAAVFAEAHPSLPNWKGRTAPLLREDLERYLMDAVRFQSLAESEGMKRFLEKERALSKSPGHKGGFGWPAPAAFESMGKGVVDALAKAPKEVAGGGKALIGGVSSVLGGGKGTTRSKASPRNLSRSATESPPALPPRTETSLSIPKSRPSQDSVRTSSPVVDTQPAPIAQMEQKPGTIPEEKPRPPPRPIAEASSVPALGGDQIIQLPPLPSDITDDYDPNIGLSRKSESTDPDLPPRPSTSTFSDSNNGPPYTDAPDPEPTKSKPKAPLTEQETQVTVELLFATIQELYTLSSAWTLRRTLLSAAKTFLIRPGNPQLLSIRDLLQSTVLDAYTSDAGIALQLRKLRLNALPTEEELKLWPPELSAKEKEELRRKARKLLVERGMPVALTSVMGTAATGEALGRVFDALQVEKVARGIVFGLMLQALREITQ